MSEQAPAQNTCGTCRHWKPPTERSGYGNAVTIHRTYPSPEYEAALQAEHDADRTYGECQVINLEAGTDLIFGAPLPLAVARDGSDYMATLFTQAEFGCAMWSAPPYLCEPCRRGEHWRCSEPGTCECTEPVA